jgi:hypothetical protein
MIQLYVVWRMICSFVESVLVEDTVAIRCFADNF